MPKRARSCPRCSQGLCRCSCIGLGRRCAPQNADASCIYWTHCVFHANLSHGNVKAFARSINPPTAGRAWSVSKGPLKSGIRNYSDWRCPYNMTTWSTSRQTNLSVETMVTMSARFIGLLEALPWLRAMAAFILTSSPVSPR